MGGGVESRVFARTYDYVDSLAEPENTQALQVGSYLHHQYDHLPNRLLVDTDSLRMILHQILQKIHQVCRALHN